MNKTQIVIIGIGSFFFLWFAGPFLVKGILNIGNATGMAVFALMIFYGIFTKKVHEGVQVFWEKKNGKAVLIILLLLAAAILFTAAAETFLMIRAAVTRPPENTTAVVLGCSVKGKRPSTILQERIDAAYEYLTENPEAFCVLSGGQGEGEDITEAECMYRSLVDLGIAPERLIKEEASTTTEENLQYTRELLREYGLENRITIVTSEFHAYRANVMAEKLGFTSYSTPSSTFFAFLPTYYVRELYGILYYSITK